MNRLAWTPEENESGRFVRRVLDVSWPDPHKLLLRVSAFLGDEAVALYLAPLHGLSARSWLFGSASMSIGDVRVTQWLSPVERRKLVRIPQAIRGAFGHDVSLVCPVRTPVWQAGCLAVSSRRRTHEQIRDIDALSTEFALEMEVADRRARCLAMRQQTEEIHTVFSSAPPMACPPSELETSRSLPAESGTMRRARAVSASLPTLKKVAAQLTEDLDEGWHTPPPQRRASGQ